MGLLRHPGVWLDAGDPAAYLEANLDLLHDRVTLALDPHPRAAVSRREGGGGHGEVPRVRLDGPVWIGHEARIGHDSHIDRSIVGHGAVLAPHTRLARCVVWDGVQVPPGDHRDTVFFADDGQVTPG